MIFFCIYSIICTILCKFCTAQSVLQVICLCFIGSVSWIIEICHNSAKLKRFWTINCYRKNNELQFIGKK